MLVLVLLLVVDVSSVAVAIAVVVNNGLKMDAIAVAEMMMERR